MNAMITMSNWKSPYNIIHCLNLTRFLIFNEAVSVQQSNELTNDKLAVDAILGVLAEAELDKHLHLGKEQCVKYLRDTFHVWTRRLLFISRKNWIPLFWLSFLNVLVVISTLACIMMPFHFFDVLSPYPMISSSECRRCLGYWLVR